MTEQNYIFASGDPNPLNLSADDRRFIVTDLDTEWHRACLAMNTTARDKRFIEWRLSPRQKEAAALLLKGIHHQQIAAMMGITEKTLKCVLTVVYKKSGAVNQAEFMAFVFPTR